MKLRIGIVFGGRSGEHEVSIQSAKNIFEALDRSKYDVLLLGVDKQGRWHLGADASFILNAADPKLIALNSRAPAVVAVDEPGSSALALKDRLISLAIERHQKENRLKREAGGT